MKALRNKLLPRSIWLLLLSMLILHLMPIGTSNSAGMSSKRLFTIRLDYILHSLIWLSFAWLWVFSRVKGFRFFKRYEAGKYILLLVISAIICEYAQMLIAWRTFNPVDLIYNLIGAGLATLFILISASASQARPKNRL